MALSFRALLVCAAVAVVASSAPVRAQTYPEKPITLLIPFAPGGGTDVVARALQPLLDRKFGQPIVIENVSGAAGNIAAARAARATPDGYTLIMHNVAFALNNTFYPKLPFDSSKDFLPILFVNQTPLVMIGRKSIPANTLAELVTWMKTNVPKIANPGVGSTGHITAVLFASAAGVKADLIPYRGGGPAQADVTAGHVDLTAATIAPAIEPIKNGLVKGFGVTSKERVKVLPEVPSVVQELGPKAEVIFWNVLLAPAGTPRPIVDKIAAVFSEVLDDPALLTSWGNQGIEAYPREQRNPEAARKMVQQEFARWAEVIRENNIEAPPH